jgi:predicted Rossmann fold nucleotide-binding protein DprA/Smf involved in DNA uptake
MLNKYQIMETIKQDTTRMKVAIIGSRVYENKKKIQETIFKLKQKFGARLQIVSGGAQNGADRYAKKYSLEMGVDYLEFNPAHTVKNLYSAMPDAYYSKQYHVSQLFHRNTLIAKYADYMIAFIDSNAKSSGSYHAVEQMKKLNKPVVIVNEKDL